MLGESPATKPRPGALCSLFMAFSWDSCLGRVSVSALTAETQRQPSQLNFWKQVRRALAGSTPELTGLPSGSSAFVSPFGGGLESPQLLSLSSGGSYVHRYSESHVKSGAEVHEGGVRGTA